MNHMDRNSLIECLIAKFKFWILTTKLRDEMIKEKIFFRLQTGLLSTISDISNIINMSLTWRETKCGYDTCSETQLEWSILVLGYYLSFKESGALSEIRQEKLKLIEYEIYDVFYSSLEKYKLYSSLWPKRHERKADKLLMKLLEDHKESVSDSQITNILKKIKYFDTD